MLDLLDYEFMRRALIAAFLTGLAAPAVGTYLVQRRLALLGDGIGHIALTGVAIGLLTRRAPLLTAVVVAAAGALVIELLRAHAGTSGDVALALLFYGGIAGGVLIVGLAGESAATLNTYLFGAITTVSSDDLVVVWVLAAAVLVFAIGLWPQLFAVCQDEEHARVSGVPARTYGLLIAVLAAVTVTVSMRTVGLLLVSALMVVPVATAQQLTQELPHHVRPRDGARRGRVAGRRRHQLPRRHRAGADHRFARPRRLRGRRAGRSAARRGGGAGASRSTTRTDSQRRTTMTSARPIRTCTGRVAVTSPWSTGTTSTTSTTGTGTCRTTTTTTSTESRGSR